MPTAPKTTRPTGPRVDLDLTTLDVEESKPFAVKIAEGVVVRLLDARDLDWQVAARLTEEAPFDLVVSIVHPADLDKFLAVKGISQRQLGKIIELYRINFGIGTQGEPSA